MAAATGLKAATRFFFHSPGDLLCQICNESSQQRRNPRLRTKRSKAAHLSVAGGEYLVEEFGWGVRRMTVSGDEMRKVADVQAEAFHVPVSFFNDVFFEFFKAEVLSALMYRIRNSPSDRYACLVAESIRAPVLLPETVEGIAGVVDCTVQSDEDVLRHLQGAEEYLYVSGIAVRSKFRGVNELSRARVRVCSSRARLSNTKLELELDSARENELIESQFEPVNEPRCSRQCLRRPCLPAGTTPRPNEPSACVVPLHKCLLYFHFSAK
ncbi:uncharacterized protein LOC110113190 isoform X1 [Dendrobium catenatum]|uniref:uncharacterized protein LOC110113190 isoform X1 n=1 Tax=Dendrobium catenatum TaxID=906689 RepID=UPI00109F5895|nr:uncharacterized protein LOC110113190 isoform X1 [Dendrobium catenatum]